MKKLQLTFKTAKGQKRNLVLNYVSAELDTPTVRKAMDKIVASQLFEKDTVQLYTKVVGAKYVERTETSLFQEDMAV
ncbi:DUF2922 domain-containing protein [Companilactobacillus nodensis]|uniref:DUF2922 domain-containing protein n=1 Tax=Companilactobacillus nodensis DSM 19682 = JCM 14932 = NBRC 107160 TaxID=1423775 RepID=A0A0R1K5V3_9LACO|nr:DUF2922 domain-containing protein [Companilactobacillus nodensis]KRK78982.1 hypothetical protein FD03_GL001342 [Companilactobacillus nodensis DSM 19682 = JCM 14932 = NBRC 107160]